MSKEKPEVGDVWKHKERGYLARIYNICLDYVSYYDTQDGCEYIEIMENGLPIKKFAEDFIFVGKGKSLEFMFEVSDE